MNTTDDTVDSYDSGVTDTTTDVADGRSPAEPAGTANAVRDDHSMEVPYDVDSFAARRDTCRTHLCEDSLSLLRTDPRMTLYLLRTLAALETFFAHYETAGSLEDALPSVNGDAFVALQTDALSSIRGHILMTFQDLDLLDTSHEGATNPDEETSIRFDPAALRSLGVSADAIPDNHDFFGLDEEDLFEPYETVLSALDEDTVSSIDTDEDRSTLDTFYSLRERYNHTDMTETRFERELSELLETETEEGRKRSTRGIDPE